MRSPLDLPPELLHHCLAYADPVDVAHFGATCRRAHTQVDQCDSLWKLCFLNLFDPPPSSWSSSSSSSSTSPALLEGPTLSLVGSAAAEAQLIDDEDANERTELPVRRASNFDYRSILHDRIYARQLLLSSPDRLDERAAQALVQIAQTRSIPSSRSEIDEDAQQPSTSLNARFLVQYLPRDLVSIHPSRHRRNLRPLTRSVSASAKHHDATNDESTTLANLLSHLHVLQTPTALTLSAPHLRTAAREVVYEHANFLRTSQWGPFVPDGSNNVDWTKLEALAVVMAANLTEAETLGWARDGTHIPKGWEMTRRGPEEEEGSRDWAGIEETEWRGTYAFLDYRTFEHFNFHRSQGVPSLMDESEAVGDCMRLKLKLLPEGELPYPPDPNRLDRGTGFDSDRGDGGDESDEDDEEDADYSIGQVFYSDDDDSSSGDEIVSDQGRSSSALDEGEETGVEDEEEPSPPTSEFVDSAETSSKPTPASSGSISANPKLSFIGTSEPLHFNGTFASAHHHFQQPNRSIRGTVSITPDGHVHWQYLIRYANADQWLMNGVQIGGKKSRYGIVGTWSSADHDRAGPCGPFWYFPHFE